MSLFDKFWEREMAPVNKRIARQMFTHLQKQMERNVRESTERQNNKEPTVDDKTREDVISDAIYCLKWNQLIPSQQATVYSVVRALQANGFIMGERPGGRAGAATETESLDEGTGSGYACQSSLGYQLPNKLSVTRETAAGSNPASPNPDNRDATIGSDNAQTVYNLLEIIKQRDALLKQAREVLEVALVEVDTALDMEGIYYGHHYGGSACEEPSVLIENLLTTLKVEGY